METLIIQVDCSNHRNGPPQLGITVEAPYSKANLLQQQQRLHQQLAKDYRNHDYQNCHVPMTTTTNSISSHSSPSKPNGISTSSSNKHNNKSAYQNGIIASTALATNSNINNHNNAKHTNTNNIVRSQHLVGEHQHIQEGLQITQIQEGSVIDRNGQFRIGDIIVEANGVNLQKPFPEAQRTLKGIVVKQPSHGPLIFKLLRKAASLSSLPSTTGSQATVIEHSLNANGNGNSTNGSTNNNSYNLSPTSTTTSPKKSTNNYNSTSTSSPRSSTSTRHLIGSFNTRKIGTKHSIKLKKSGSGGFGIKIAERDNMFGANRPIYITAITTTGSAYRDGRLKEGDMLLKVNGIDLSDKSQPEVTRMLKSVPVNEAVEFVVSRQDDPQTIVEHIDKQSTEISCDNNHMSLIDLDVPNQDDHVFYDHTSNHHFEKKVDSILNMPNIDGPGAYVYDIPLNDTKSAGLGLYLKYPTLDGKDLGIWIEKVITGGAAWKDGRLQPDDQILAINGISLMDLSNVEASETLTAAVCRGIGPEATSNTIRLDILRRDPSVVAKILHGTNNRIQHSDLPTNQSYSINDRIVNSTEDSYQTALDHTIHNRSQSSSNETSGSNKSSNQNSHNDSAMSPQTQASISLKLSHSCNDKSDHNISDKTNDTSSATSQITDFTSVPVTEHTTSEKDCSNSDNQAAFTLPKTLELADGIQNLDLASTQSWDDESIDAATGEERFQRDGFGRQSISEKRHAQLMAKNTDTYKRNQKLREEREKERHIQDLQGRQRELENQQQEQLQQRLHQYQHQQQKHQHHQYQHLSQPQLHAQQQPQQQPQPQQIYSSHIGYDNHIFKKSNSLESIQRYETMREGLIIPRAGTVRVARNRKINESFRAAVDRSYESSINNSARFECSNGEQRQLSTTSTKMNSVANSTTSTSNDERFLIGDNNGITTTNHKKSSSLFTKFLKFGSMKKNKKKNKDSVKSSDTKTPKEIFGRESETNRSQSSKSSHSRTQSLQSHSNSSHNYNSQHQQQHQMSATQLKAGINNQVHSPSNFKQVQSLHQAQYPINKIDLQQLHIQQHHHQQHPQQQQLHQSNRGSIHMHYQPVHSSALQDNNCQFGSPLVFSNYGSNFGPSYGSNFGPNYVSPNYESNNYVPNFGPSYTTSNYGAATNAPANYGGPPFAIRQPQILPPNVPSYPVNNSWSRQPTYQAPAQYIVPKAPSPARQCRQQTSACRPIDHVAMQPDWQVHVNSTPLPLHARRFVPNGASNLQVRSDPLSATTVSPLSSLTPAQHFANHASPLYTSPQGPGRQQPIWVHPYSVPQGTLQTKPQEPLQTADQDQYYQLDIC